MSQFGAIWNAPADSAFCSDGATTSIRERRAAADPSNVLTIVGTITSQVVLTTALFYYGLCTQPGGFWGDGRSTTSDA